MVRRGEDAPIGRQDNKKRMRKKELQPWKAEKNNCQRLTVPGNESQTLKNNVEKNKTEKTILKGIIEKGIWAKKVC